MLEIFHISDLHIGKHTRLVQKLLDKIQEKFKIGEQEHRYLIVTGDIVQDGTKRQFVRALKALLPFKGKVMIVPGNHDYGVLGFMYSDHRAKNFDSLLTRGVGIDHEFFPNIPFLRLLEDGNGSRLLLIGLNSCSQTKSLLDIAKGEIGEGQLESLDKLLVDPNYSEIPTIVFLHHIPHRRAHGIGMSLKDYKKLMAVLKDRVEALIFGHEGDFDEIKNISGKNLNIPIIAQKELKKVDETEIPVRAIKLRSGKSQGILYYLDANKTVVEQACYRISVDGTDMSAKSIWLDKEN
ncbi:metallophosphoesterase family protein [Acidobacteriota bacterium]